MRKSTVLLRRMIGAYYLHCLASMIYFSTDVCDVSISEDAYVSAWHEFAWLESLNTDSLKQQPTWFIYFVLLLFFIE